MTSSDESMRQKVDDAMEGTTMRQELEFKKTEAMLFEKLTKAGVSSISTTALVKIPGVIATGLSSLLGEWNPMIRRARADRNEVWILDNTAYKTSDGSTWVAEVVACFFQHGRGDLVQAAATIADTIGLDGEPGEQEKKRKLIAERLKPFIDAIAPARTLPVVINEKQSVKRQLGPSNASGISSQILEVGAYDQSNGASNEIVTDTSVANLPEARGVTRLASAEGWGIISDIDDTIKITQVSSEAFPSFLKLLT